MKKILIFCAVIFLWPKLVLGEFINNGNSTVTDTITGLMWEVKTDDGGSRDKDNAYNWEGALSYCENLTLVGYNDWRLPNRNELQSLVDYSQYYPSIDTSFFPNTVSSYYWSSTTYAYSPYSAWVVYFYDGGVVYYGKSGSSYVRAVRAGQCGSFGLFVPILDQRDPRWGEEQLGDPAGCPGQKIKDWGCTVTSLTMVAQFFNVPDLTVPAEHSETGEERIGLDPAIVDDWLRWKGAYVNGCDMGHNWEILPPGVKASNIHYNSNYYSTPPGISPGTYGFIDTSLENQRPVIAWIKDPNDANFTHFVVIRGRADDSYYINDPWNGVVTTLENGELGNYLNDKAIYSCREFYRDSDYDDVPDIDEYNYGTQTNSGYASDPVNTALGNYTYAHTDLKIPGRGMPFEFKRGYNSLDPYSGPLGYGWTHSYNISLSEYESVAVVKWGDGKEDVYDKQGDGSYLPAFGGMYDELVKNVDDTYTLTKKDQTRYQFDTTGKLTSIEDKNGNTITLTYDIDGNLVTITDTAGRDISLTYDVQGRITQITDPISRTIDYLYDVSGDLIKVTDARGGETLFGYDAEHRITSITLPEGNTLLVNVYDTEGRVISQTNGRGYTTNFAYDTPDVNQTTITDPLTNTTIHIHDTSHRLIESIDALNKSIQYTYDSNNNRTQIIDKNGNTISYTYDSMGNVLSKTDALDNVTEITYDAKNNPLTRTDALGNETTYNYDSNGNLTSIVDALENTSSITYDSYGQPLTITDANVNTTTNTYDAEGNLTEIEDALHYTTAFTYDDVGRKLSITDANTHTTSFTYDNNNNVLTITDPLTGVITYVYDENDNKTSVTDPELNTTYSGPQK